MSSKQAVTFDADIWGQIMLKPDIIHELQDMRHLEWARIRHSSGTAGSYLKAYSVSRGKKLYYKLSCYDSVNGITGHECVNELIADRLLTILGIEHLGYQLIHGLICIGDKEYKTYLCASEDFKSVGDSKIALDDYYDLEREEGESVLDFCIRMGWYDYICRMLTVDFLILNRDRHGANIEILRHGSSGIVRPAPIFDHGISLIYNCRSEEDAAKVDPLEDKPVQSFIGSRSSLENLKLIKPGNFPALRDLEERDRAVLFAGMEGILPGIYLDKIWEMIWRRWQIYEAVRDSR